MSYIVCDSSLRSAIQALARYTTGFEQLHFHQFFTLNNFYNFFLTEYKSILKAILCLQKEVRSPNNEPSEIVLSHISQQGSCNKDDMEVETSDSKTAKKLCCLYCKKSVIALWRHLATVHKNEPDVQKFNKLPKGIFYQKIDFKVIRCY